jgi:creatinine amidohydrolase
MNPPRPWCVAESTWAVVRESAYDIAVLPWGATEPHGTHLPYATDVIEAESIAWAAAEIAWGRGAKVAVLPAIPFGVQTGQLDLPLCVNLMPSTQLAMLRDIVASVRGAGPKKFVIFNGHGGNDFRPIVRELQPAFPDVLLSVTSWFAMHDGKGVIDVIGDHADERETSLMLHLRPDLVAERSTWGDGATKQHRIDAHRTGRAWSPRPWTEVSAETGVGDPSAATAENGRRYFDAIVSRLADYFVQLAAADPDRLYG